MVKDPWLRKQRKSAEDVLYEFKAERAARGFEVSDVAERGTGGDNILAWKFPPGTAAATSPQPA